MRQTYRATKDEPAAAKAAPPPPAPEPDEPAEDVGKSVHDLLVHLASVAEQYNHHWNDELRLRVEHAKAVVQKAKWGK